MNELLHPAVAEAIDDVYAILEVKAAAGEDDHETDPELDDAVATFVRFDEHCPAIWDDLDAFGRGRALALVLALAGEGSPRDRR